MNANTIRAKQMYRYGAPLADIQARTGLTRAQVQRAIAGEQRPRKYRMREAVEELLAEGHDQRIVEAVFGK